MSNYIQYIVLDDIIYHFPNFNGANRWSFGMDEYFHPTLR